MKKKLILLTNCYKENMEQILFLENKTKKYILNENILIRL